MAQQRERAKADARERNRAVKERLERLVRLPAVGADAAELANYLGDKAVRVVLDALHEHALVHVRGMHLLVREEMVQIEPLPLSLPAAVRHDAVAEQHR